MADEKKLIPITGLDQAGIIKDSPPHILPPNAFSDGKNIRFKDGSVQKRKGTIKALDDISAISSNVTDANRGSTSNTATFTFDKQPGLTEGSVFTISGVIASVDPTAFNGSFTVHSISEDLLTYTIEEDISSAVNTGNYTSGGTYSFTGTIDFFDYWPAPNHPQYIEVQKNTGVSPAVPVINSIRSSGDREQVDFERFNVKSITKTTNAVIKVDGYLYLEVGDNLRIFDANPSDFSKTYSTSAVSYSEANDETTLTTTEDNSSFSTVYTVDSAYAAPSVSIKATRYPSGKELQWQSTLFTGGYAYVLNDGFHTPQYALANLSSSYVVPTFRDLPGWDWQKNLNDTHIGCKVVRSYNNVLIAGNLSEYAISNGIASTNPIKTYPGTIRVSTAAPAGGIPSTWEPGLTTAFADEFELSTTSEVQDIVPLQGTAIIYTSDSIHSLRFDSRGLPSVQTVAEGIGALDTGSVLQYDGKHFVIGSDDIYLFGGHPGSIESVANSKMRNYFFENLNPLKVNRQNVFLIRDHSLDEIKIYFPNKLSTDGTCNEYIAWNYRNNTWSSNDCDSLISGVFAPVRGGGVAGGDVVFAGITNTADTAEAEEQTLTVALTSDYPTTGVNEIQQIDYSSSNTTTASTYDSEAVVLLIDENVIPYNEEHIDIEFASNFQAESTKVISETGTNTESYIDSTQLQVTRSNPTYARNDALATPSLGITSTTYTTGDYVSGTTGQGGVEHNIITSGSSVILKNENENSQLGSQPAYPSYESNYRNSGATLDLWLHNADTYTGDIIKPEGSVVNYTWRPTVTKIIDSSGNNVTSSFTVKNSSHSINSNGSVRVTLSGNNDASFDLDEVEYVEILFDYYTFISQVTYPYPFRLGFKINRTSYQSESTYRVTNSYYDKFNADTLYFSTSGLNKYTNFTVTNYFRDTTISNIASGDAVTLSVPVSSNFNETRTTNGLLTTPVFSSANSYQSTWSLTGTGNIPAVAGTHNGSSIETIATLIPSAVDLISEASNISSRTQTSTLTANARGSSGTSYQKTSAGYGFFTNSKETSVLLDGVEEFGFKLPGSDLPAGDYNISHSSTFGSTVNRLYTHDGLSDIIYVCENIKYISVPTFITITGKANTKVKNFIRTITKTGGSSPVTFVSNGETVQSRFFNIDLSAVTGITYKLRNISSDIRSGRLVLTVNGIVTDTLDLAGGSSIEVVCYGSVSSKNYEVTIGSESSIQVSGSQGFPTITSYFHKEDNAVAAATYLVDAINSKTNSKVRASIKGVTGADARTVRVYYANNNATSAGITHTAVEGADATAAATSDFTRSTVDAHRSTFSSWRVVILDSLGNSVIDEAYTATSATVTPTQIGEFIRNEVIADVNASGVIPDSEVWYDANSGIDGEGNYLVYIGIPSQENYTITITDNINTVNGNVSGYYNEVVASSVLSSNSGDTPDLVVLKDPFNTEILSFNLGSGETIDQVMGRIKDLIQTDLSDGWTAVVDTSNDTLTFTATQAGTTPVQAGGVADSVHTGSGVFRFEYTKGLTVTDDGDLPSTLNASITTVGSNASVELTLYDPWRGVDDTFQAGGSNNADIAESIAIEISRKWPNWNASFNNGVVTAVTKNKDWVLSDRTGIVSNDVTFATRAIYVKTVAYPSGTVGATGNAAIGTFTALSQSSNFTSAQSVIGHPLINESVLALTVTYSDGSITTENIQFDDGSNSIDMATRFASTINGASVEAFEATRVGSTVTISITDFTVGVDNIELTFDSQTSSGNRDTVSRTNGNNLGTAGVTQVEPTGTTTGLKVTTNSERPYSNAEFDLSRLVPIIASKTKVFAENFGYAKGADPTASPMVHGTAYVSFVERQQLPVDGSVEYKKDVSFIQLLVEDGNVGVKLSGSDAPGAILNLENSTRKVFDYKLDYKVDFRENGRVLAYRIEDENPGTSTVGWKISGVGFKIDAAESRGKR